MDSIELRTDDYQANGNIKFLINGRDLLNVINEAIILESYKLGLPIEVQGYHFTKNLLNFYVGMMENDMYRNYSVCTYEDDKHGKVYVGIKVGGNPSKIIFSDIVVLYKDREIKLDHIGFICSSDECLQELAKIRRIIPGKRMDSEKREEFIKRIENEVIGIMREETDWDERCDRYMDGTIWKELAYRMQFVNETIPDCFSYYVYDRIYDKLSYLEAKDRLELVYFDVLKDYEPESFTEAGRRCEVAAFNVQDEICDNIFKRAGNEVLNVDAEGRFINEEEEY